MKHKHHVFYVALLVAGALPGCSKASKPAASQDTAAHGTQPARSTEATPAVTTPNAQAPMAHPIDSDIQQLLFSTPISTLDGEPSTLGAHKGKALLVVNVASKCGLTPQYAELEKLQEQYAGRGFSVVGFPCNQFGGQEPGTAEEIKTFCSVNYGVTFPMYEKIEVNGDQRHPIYAALTKIPDSEGKTGDIQWNFEKFVISADGTRITRFRPRTVPSDPTLIAAIEAALLQ